jgi:hypothetical protein
VPSKEELAEGAKATGIDCLATRWLMAIGIEVVERLGPEFDDWGMAAAAKHLLGQDMVVWGNEPHSFSDERLAELQEEARAIVDALVGRRTMP